ncbi:monovalent cation:H+ antiporter, CPA1 (nhx1) [Hanseniaspora valbyensis]
MLESLPTLRLLIRGFVGNFLYKVIYRIINTYFFNNTQNSSISSVFVAAIKVDFGTDDGDTSDELLDNNKDGSKNQDSTIVNDPDALPTDGSDGTTPGIPVPDTDDDLLKEEIYTSWALFILLFLLISALWSSYYLQQRRIKAVHETVLSIFYGMIVGLIIRLSPGNYIQSSVTFNSSYFFNVLLPPIILNSGYELNQRNFFNNLFPILVYAIPGTLISAVVMGTIMFIWTSLGLEGVKISFVDALSVGATLSATDPITILSIFNAYKVDPKLYTIIFGESLLNDAISIVMFETCQKFHDKPAKLSSFFEAIMSFILTFSVSLLIGFVTGILVALILKHSLIRRYPHLESCLIVIIAYESYFFSNACHMSGIVSLLFCGITLKHYAHYNMSRKTQVTIKYIFQLLARLSENFIFIYLGLALFTQVELEYKPLLIIVAAISIVVSRWCAVFPLSDLINKFYRYKKLRGDMNGASVTSFGSLTDVPDEIPYEYKMMTFWAGLRGAVGVALAMGIQGDQKWTLLATVLVVVVLTVVLFGGTTANMLEILKIKTGCIDELDADSDDEFEIEQPRTFNDIDNPAVFNMTNVRSEQDLLNREHQDFYSDEDPKDDAITANLSVSNLLKGGFHNFDEQVLKPVLLDHPKNQRSTSRSP